MRASVAASAPELESLEHRRGLDALVAFRDPRVDAEMLLVPGGTFVMGFASDDLLDVVRVFEREELREAEHLADALASSRPPRAVTVRPFLASRGRIPEEVLLAASKEKELSKALRALGLRLLSEAEWEWIAREGDEVSFVGVPRNAHPLRSTLSPPAKEENGWGFLSLLNEPESLADGWHPDHVGAPTTSAARSPESSPAVGRMGHTFWQSTEEAIGLHAASRFSERRHGPYRVARDVPFEPSEASPVDWSDVASPVVAALTSDKATERTRGLAVLAAICAAPGPDTVALASLLVSEIASSPVATKLLLRLGTALRTAEGEVRTALAAACDALPSTLLAQPPLAAAMAFFVASSSSDARRKLTRLREAWPDEGQTEALAAFLLAMGELSRAAKLPAPAELRAHLDDAKPLVRGAAALACLESGSAPDDAITKALAAAVRVRRVRDFPYFHGDVADEARERMASVGDASAAADSVRATIESARDEKVIKKALVSLFPTFRGAPDELPPVLEVEALSPAQREVAIALSDPGPKIPVFELSTFGLPDQLQDRRIWLGLDPPLFLESARSLPWPGGARERPIWRWMRESDALARAETWEAPEWEAHVAPFAASLSPLDRLAMHLELRRHDLSRRMKSRSGAWIEKTAFLGSFDEALAAALAHDREGARAAAHRALEAYRIGHDLERERGFVSPMPAWTVLDRVMGPKEVLDPSLVPLLPVHANTPRSLFARVPVAACEALVHAHLSARFRSRHAGFWPVADIVLRDAQLAISRGMSERNAQLALAIGVAGGEGATRVALQIVGRYKRLPGAAKRLAEIEKLRPITTPKAQREALKALGPI
ncbi:MAG: hypothetical protein R3B99_05610 [Polyangiales bacterium]